MNLYEHLLADVTRTKEFDCKMPTGNVLVATDIWHSTNPEFHELFEALQAAGLTVQHSALLPVGRVIALGEIAHELQVAEKFRKLVEGN